MSRELKESTTVESSRTPEPHAPKYTSEQGLCRRYVVVWILLGQQRGDRRELREVARQRVEQADLVGAVAVEQDEEALAGLGEHRVVEELREADLDALAGGEVEEAAAVVWFCGAVRFVEHDPPPGVEPAVQAAVRVQVRGGEPPGDAHGAEADVFGDAVGEEALRDHGRRSVRKIRPGSPE
jgi:hypothetical protein